MKNYNGNDIVCSLVIIMIITIVYNFIFKKKEIEGFEWMKETDNIAWKKELVNLFGEKGENYRGSVNTTIDGTECRKWKDADPESVGVPDFEEEDERLKLFGDSDADVSYCRNIGNKMDGPWCITGAGNGMVVPNINTKKGCETPVKGQTELRKWDPDANDEKGACMSDKQICVDNDWTEIREELKGEMEDLPECIKVGKEFISGEIAGAGSLGSLMGSSTGGVSIENRALDCQDRCSGQGECRYFTWRVEGGKCRLFGEDAKGSKNIKDSTKLSFSGPANCSTEGGNPNLVVNESESEEPLPLMHPNASKALEAYNTQIKDRMVKYMKSKVEHVTKKRTCACDGDPNANDNFNENCSDCKVGYSVHKNKTTGKWECLKDKCFLTGKGFLQDQKYVSGLGCITDNDIKDVIDWRYFTRKDGKFFRGSKTSWSYDIDQINIDDNGGKGICKVGKNKNSLYSFITPEDIRTGKCSNIDSKVVGVGGTGSDKKKVFLDKMCVRLNVKGFTFKDVKYEKGEYVYTFIINPVKNISNDSLDLLKKLPKIKVGDNTSKGVARIIVSKNVENLYGSMLDESKNQRDLDKTKPEIIALQELFEFASFGVKEDFSKDKSNNNASVHQINKNGDGHFELSIRGCKNINFFNKKGCQINNKNQPTPNNWRGHTAISSEITPQMASGQVNGFLKNDNGEPWRDNKVKTIKDMGEKKTCKRLLFEEKRAKNKALDTTNDDTKISDVTEGDMILIKPGTVFPSIGNGEKNGFINVMFNIVKSGSGDDAEYMINNNDTVCTNQRKIQTTFSIKGNWDFYKTPNSGKEGELRKLGYTGIYDFCYNGSCKLDSNFSDEYEPDTNDLCPKINRYALTKHNYWSSIPGSNRCNCVLDLESRDIKFTTQKEADLKNVKGGGSDPYKVCFAKLGVCDAISGGKKINDKCRGGVYGKPDKLNPKGKDRHTEAKCSDEPYGECECKEGWEIDPDPDSKTYGLCKNKSTGTCINNGATKNRKWLKSEAKLWHTGSILGTPWNKIYQGTKFGEIGKKYWVEIKIKDATMVSDPKNGVSKESLFYMWLKDRHFGHYRNPKDHPDIQIVQTYLVDNENRNKTRININNGVEWLLTYGNNIRGFRNKEAGNDKNGWSKKKSLRKKLFLYGKLKRNLKDFDFTGDFIISEVPTKKPKPNELWNDTDPYAQPYKSYKKNDMWIHECNCGKYNSAKGAELLNPFTNCACPYGTLLIHSDYKDDKGKVATIPSCKIITKGCSGYGYGDKMDSKNTWRGIGRQTRQMIDGGSGLKISKTASRLNDSERDMKNMGRTIGHFFNYENKECNFLHDKQKNEARSMVGKGRTIRDHKVAGVPIKGEWNDICCSSCKDKGENDSWTSIVSPEFSKTKIAFPDTLIDSASHYTILSDDVYKNVMDPRTDNLKDAAKDNSRAIGLEPMHISLVKDGWDPINNEKKFMGYGYNSRRVHDGTYSDRRLISGACDTVENLKVLERSCDIKEEKGDDTDPSQAGRTYKYLKNCRGNLENVKGSDIAGDDEENVDGEKGGDENVDGVNKAAQRIACKIPIEKLHRKLHYCQKTDFPPLKQDKVSYQDKLSTHGVDPTDRVISYHQGYPSEKCDRSFVDAEVPWDGDATSGVKSLGKGANMFKECKEDTKTSDAWDTPPEPTDYKVAIQTRCHGTKCVDVIDNDLTKKSKFSDLKDISDTLQNDRGYSDHVVLDNHEGNHFYFEPRLRYNKGALVWRKEGDVWPGLIGSDWEPGPHAKPGSKEEDCRVGIVSNAKLLERGCIPSMSSWGLVGISPGWHESQSKDATKEWWDGEVEGKKVSQPSVEGGQSKVVGTGLPINLHNRGSPAGSSNTSECTGQTYMGGKGQNWKCIYNATPAAADARNFAMAKTDSKNLPSDKKEGTGSGNCTKNFKDIGSGRYCAGSTDVCYGGCSAASTNMGKTLTTSGEFGFGGNSLNQSDPAKGRSGAKHSWDNSQVEWYIGAQDPNWGKIDYCDGNNTNGYCKRLSDCATGGASDSCKQGFQNQKEDDIVEGWSDDDHPGTIDTHSGKRSQRAVFRRVGQVGKKWLYGPPNYGWELKGGMGNWWGYKSMSNGGLSSWNFWTGMGAHRPLGWPGGDNNKHKLDTNFQDWWRKVHQSYFNVHHNREGEKDKGIQGGRLQGLKDMDDIGCAIGDMIPTSTNMASDKYRPLDGFDEFSNYKTSGSPTWSTDKPGHEVHGYIAMRTLPLHVNAKGPNVGASGGQYGGQDSDKGRAQLSGNAWEWGPKLREIGDIAGGWGQARHVAYGKRPRYLVKTIAPLLSGIGGGEHIAAQNGTEGWKDYNFRSITGANGTSFERIMHSNNFNHLCVKSALRTVGPGRDKSCQLYLNTGSCRPPKNMKGMDSDKGGTGNWSLKDSRSSGNKTAIGIDCGTVMSGARCLNPSGVKRFEKLDDLKKKYAPGKGAAYRDIIKVDYTTLPGSRYFDENKWGGDDKKIVAPILEDMVKLPFSLEENVGSSKTPLHTLYDSPDGGINWGSMPESDMNVSINSLQRGKLEAEKMRGGSATSLHDGAFEESTVWGTKSEPKRYAGPDPTGKTKAGTKYNWGGGPFHCGQARLNPSCAWGECSPSADNLPPNLKKGSKSRTDYTDTPNGKGIAGVRPLSAVHQSWGACGWSPGYMGLKPLISSQLKDNEINKNIRGGHDGKCKGKSCKMPVNSLVDQEKAGGTVNDLSWIHPNITFKGQKGGWVFDRYRDDRDAGGGFSSIENPRMDGPMGEIRTLDQFAENKDHQGKVEKNIFGYHDTKDQLLDHTEDRIMNKEGLVINTIDRQLADGNQCTVSGRESAVCPRGIGTCLVMGGGGYDNRQDKEQRFYNQFTKGNDMTAVYDMNNRERCPTNPTGNLKQVPYTKGHTSKKDITTNDKLSGYGWVGIPYDDEGKRCSSKNVSDRCADANYRNTFSQQVEGFSNEEMAGNIRRLSKGLSKEYKKLLTQTKHSKNNMRKHASKDKRMRQKLLDNKIKDRYHDGGGNMKGTSTNLMAIREGLKRPKYSADEVFHQISVPDTSKEEGFDNSSGEKIIEGYVPFDWSVRMDAQLINDPKLLADKKIDDNRLQKKLKSTSSADAIPEEMDVINKMNIKYQPACKIGPLTPIRHVCKSMQPFKWIPDPLEDMDNRAQYFEKSRKVHPCHDVNWNGNGMGSGYQENCAQAGIHNEPNDSELKLRAQYWDKTYSDKRRNYAKKDAKKINALDQLFLENSLDSQKQAISYKKQRDLKAQMVYEDEVRSYYQS